MGLQGESTLSDVEKYTECVKHLAHLEDYFEEMTQVERTFVEQMSERIERFGPKVSISNKQLFWLRDLNSKY